MPDRENKCLKEINFFCTNNRNPAKDVDHPSNKMGHLTSTTTTLVYDNLNNNVKPMTKDCLDQSINDSSNNNNNNNNLSKICIRDRDDVDDSIGDSKICDNTENKVGNGKVNDGKKESDGYTYFGFIKVNAKLKWDNIIGILIIHSMFVYTFLHWNNIPTNILTYLWGKSFIYSS